MTEQDAINAARLIRDWCESFDVCKDCVFCLNPQQERGYAECFFRDGNRDPSHWWKFLEAQYDD